MNTRSAVLAAVVLAASPAFAADTYTFDKAHTTVLFQVRHLLTNVTGKFKDFEGTIQVDRVNPTASSVDFTVQAASIDTSEAKRDEHLRSADFFDVANHPKLSFRSTSVKPAGKDAYQVTGELTMHGVTKPVTLTINSFLCKPNPMNKKEVCGADASAVFNRGDFGLNFGDKYGFKMETKLLIQVEGSPASATPTG